MGEDGWELKAIVFNEFNIREDNGETFGTIEVIDGRRGASVKIGKSKWEENE